MPRKTKEINEEKPVKKESKLNKKIDSLIKAVLNSEDTVADDKKTTKKAKSTATKAKSSKATKSKVSQSTSEKKVVTKSKATKATRSADKKEEEKSTKTTASKKKTTEKKTKSSDTKATKTSTKKTSAEPKTAKKKVAEEKKTTAKKATKTAAKTSTKTTKKSKTSKEKATAKTTTKKTKKVAPPTVVEYYDLPYKYNQTVVKVLYQNPTTLFVYWEISDNDIENYKKQYGENFFDTTRPVLVVYNDTMNYSFEIDINDFANSWYFNINDSKCDYRVELMRRPVFYNEKIGSNHIFITSSNNIETPNDKILFSTDEPDVVYFRNTKNNTQRKVYLSSLLESLNLTNKNFGFPIVRNVYDLYKNIYNIEDVGEFSISLTNPSSGNPSSHSLTSRFI